MPALPGPKPRAMRPTTPRIAELHAPAAWRVVDFISDLHLQADQPLTVQRWADYLARTRADAVFILGDLFEAWIGDDVLAASAGAASPGGFEADCAEILRQAASRCAVYFMHGNRDFLVGEALARHCTLTLLHDPTTLVYGGQRWLLSHGDELCLDDRDYLQFRAQVRQPAWQQAFLQRPMAERRAIARGLRQESQARKDGGASYADVDADAARAWLQAAGATALIHGHTHQPADHLLGPGLRRHVLSDWEPQADPARAEVLRLRLAGDTVTLQRLPADAV